MDVARAVGFVVLTHDLDFATREDTSPETIGDFVTTALKQAALELSEGAIISIDPSRVRLRILPSRSDEHL